MRVLRWLKAIAGFWVDFIVGDDWTVAAAVAVALVGTWGPFGRPSCLPGGCFLPRS